MKCAGCRCSFGLGLVLGTILLSAVALTAQQTPAVMPSLLSPKVPLRATLLLETPGPASTVTDKLAQLDKEVKAAQSSADNAWMLVSAALVLMMTGPGRSEERRVGKEWRCRGSSYHEKKKAYSAIRRT